MLWILVATVLAPQGGVRAVVRQSGQVELMSGRTPVGSLTAGVWEADWRFRTLAEARSQPLDEREGGEAACSATIETTGGIVVSCASSLAPTERGLRARYRLTSPSAMQVNAITASLSLPSGPWEGAVWNAGERSGTIPARFGGEVHVWSGTTSELTLTASDGRRLVVRSDGQTPVLLQDSRQWGPNLEVRVGPGSQTWEANDEVAIELELDLGEGIDVVFDKPTTLVADDRWVPLEASLDIVPGSALDWSDQGLCDAPAGKYGPVVVGSGGRLEFRDRPGVPFRIWGVNLCFGALYPDHAGSERLATRLRMLGYNAVRIHHYESSLIRREAPNSTTLDADRLDRIEYLIDALARQGIYVTTEGYVSRPVKRSEIVAGAEGEVPMDMFKMLALVDERASECWEAFVREFLGHVNPYRGVPLAQDPALCSFVLINEGNAGNFIENLDDFTRPVWLARWNAWLGARYRDRSALAAEWGEALAVDEDPAAGSVALRRVGGRRATDMSLFLASVHREAYARMARFLRDELGMSVPLTDMNAWTETYASQAVRGEFDYVDTHYYWDHPRFLERDWSLPSGSWVGGRSMTEGGGTGARDQAFLRLLDRPFTISEFNEPYPNEFRAESGLLMGAVTALQGWDGAYRFAYSHDEGKLFQPGACNYFDLASDPLNVASDRAGILLFARGDLRAAPHSLAVRLDPERLLDNPDSLPDLGFPLRELAWITRIGTQLGEGEADLAFAATDGVRSSGVSGDPRDPASLAEAVGAMREAGWLSPDNPTDLESHVYASETGEVVLDADNATFTVATPRLAAVWSRDAGTTLRAGGLEVTFVGSGGAVWVASLDRQPIATSRRLVLAHLTDLQNTGSRFRDADRTILESYGGLPWLVRDGSAQVTLARAGGEPLTCWGLSLDGTRGETVPVEAGGGALSLTPSVRGPQGARLYYELSTR